ncbi:Opine oxidase subunit B [Fusarium austroafricanum]|uniref:Opine oxidase subunit B n=1 Tax=Fusarium austroafricanum TaxID=2364996 RepID=A0A8H4KEB3_9HYPO|nr:Opine oxidase subunit B [Fusarium austroafricanum]
MLGSSNIATVIGPIVGGALTSYLSWRWIFWLLTILSGVCLVLFALVFPETARPIVGDGSSPVSGLCRTIISYIRPLDKTYTGESPDSLKLLRAKDTALITMIFGIFYMKLSSLQASTLTLLIAVYNTSGVQLGLVYLPSGIGSCLGAYGAEEAKFRSIWYFVGAGALSTTGYGWALKFEAVCGNTPYRYPPKVAIFSTGGQQYSHSMPPDGKFSKMSVANANVVVVGGGIVGASIAWHLSSQTNVTIIAEDIGGVATPNSFAWLNAASSDQKFYYDFRLRSLEHWREIEKVVNDLPIHWGGTTSWDKPPKELEEEQKNLTSWGYDVVRVDKTEISSREPHIEEAILPEWGLGYDEEGALEAETAARLLIELSKDNGAKVIETKVKGFKKTDDRISGVTLSSGEVLPADHVVVAAGLGSVSLLASENIKLPLKSTAGLLANTKPTDKKLINGVVNAHEMHIRQTLEGVLLFGASYAGGDLGQDPEKTARELFARLQKSVAGGDELEFSHYTIGHRVLPEDGLPILGETGLDGLSVAVMHSGVTNGALVGKLLSEQIINGKKDPMLDSFRLDRFS